MRKLDKPTRDRIMKAAQLLEVNPHPPVAKRLTGTGNPADTPSIFRIRTGDWRLLYTVHNHELTVLVVKVGHRSQIYRKL